MKELNPESLMMEFSKQQNLSDVVKVLQELFDVKKLRLITDLSEDEIKLITRIRLVANIKDIPIWDQGLDEFMAMQLSKKRRSRSEIIDAIKGYTQQKQGFLPRLFGGGNRI